MVLDILKRPTVWRPALVLCSAVVVLLGAYGAERLGGQMMNAGALVGAWMMLALVFCYLVVRFRPAVGIPIIVGFSGAAVFVAALAGMAMMR
jgi:hypothetical protein